MRSSASILREKEQHPILSQLEESYYHHNDVENQLLGEGYNGDDKVDFSMKERKKQGSKKATDPEPPVWPNQFHATMQQNRDGALADVDLYYDWENGRNMNIIDDGIKVLYDNERNNGSTYYYYPEETTLLSGEEGAQFIEIKKRQVRTLRGDTTVGETNADECKVMNSGVGILTPDWLKGAKYLGTQIITTLNRGDVKTDVFSKNGAGHFPFVTYYNDIQKNIPARWIFFDNATFDVLTWTQNENLSEEKWQIPESCF